MKRELPQLSKAKFVQNDSNMIDLRTTEANLLVNSASKLSEFMIHANLDEKISKNGLEKRLYK